MLFAVVVVVFVSHEILLEELGIRSEGGGLISAEVGLRDHWGWLRLLGLGQGRRGKQILIGWSEHCIRYHSLACLDWCHMLVYARYS